MLIRSGHDQDIWIAGFDTSKCVDDKPADMRNKVFEIVGIKSYPIVSGSTKTIPLFKFHNIKDQVIKATDPKAKQAEKEKQNSKGKKASKKPRADK